MTVAELRALRQTLSLSQTAMARGMGLSMRAYQDIERAEGEVKTRHAMLAERLAQKIAIEERNPMLAPVNIRREALDLARMIRGE